MTFIQPAAFLLRAIFLPAGASFVLDELLETVLSEDLRYNVEWDFADGVS